MKKSILWCILVVSLLSLAGCRRPLTVFDLETYEIKAHEGPWGFRYNRPKRTFSYVMEQLGEDGLVVAGYATGLRKSYANHTATTFAVTDVYRGKVKKNTVTVKESYAVKGNTLWQYSYNEARLKNNIQVLLFLYKESAGMYAMACEFIPLPKDYGDYNGDYVKSLFDFYRGVPSVYKSEDGVWTEPYEEVIENALGETVTKKDYMYCWINPWPRQDISDQEVREQFSDNLIFRAATEFEIVIWPYGHKNYELKSSVNTPKDFRAFSSYNEWEYLFW